MPPPRRTNLGRRTRNTASQRNIRANLTDEQREARNDLQRKRNQHRNVQEASPVPPQAEIIEADLYKRSYFGPDVPTLEMECWEEELSEAQLKAHQTATEEYQSIQNKLDVIVKDTGGKIVYNGDQFTAYQLLGKDVVTQILSSSLVRDGSPLGLHYIMFLPTIMTQTNEEQRAKWLPKSWNCNIIGSYAQTELGHGTFIRGLETTATYDPSTEEFVVNSPTLTSYKWWPGGLGHTANYCILMAQLYTNGKCYGIHQFIVQLRDEETHVPLPGIKIGDIGAKLGLNEVNNGFVGFDHVRIPKDHMLMKHAQVLEDGTYIKSLNSKLNYGPMMFTRVVIVFDMTNYLSKVATIAVRYSAVRRQSQRRPGEEFVGYFQYN